MAKCKDENLILGGELPCIKLDCLYVPLDESIRRISFHADGTTKTYTPEQLRKLLNFPKPETT